MGIVLFEVFSRQDPYEGENHMEVLIQIVDRRLDKRPDIPDSCPPVASRLMQKCWSQLPRERADIA